MKDAETEAVPEPPEPPAQPLPRRRRRARRRVEFLARRDVFRAPRLRLLLLLVIVVPAFVNVGARLWWLHDGDGPQIRERTRNTRDKYETTSALRGRIEDANGEVLARTRETWLVKLDPHQLHAEQRAKVAAAWRAEITARRAGKSADKRDGTTFRADKTREFAAELDAKIVRLAALLADAGGGDAEVLRGKFRPVWRQLPEIEAERAKRRREALEEAAALDAHRAERLARAKTLDEVRRICGERDAPENAAASATGTTTGAGDSGDGAAASPAAEAEGPMDVGRFAWLATGLTRLLDHFHPQWRGEVARVRARRELQTAVRRKDAAGWSTGILDGPPKTSVRLAERGVSANVRAQIDDLKIGAALTFEPRHVREYMKFAPPPPSRLGIAGAAATPPPAAQPERSLAAHIIGHMRKDGSTARGGTAVTGIERAHDNVLVGCDGFIRTQKDGRGREIRSRRIEERDPVSGATVRLTLKAAIQNDCEEIADAAFAKYSPRFMSILVSEARTGRLLALVNRPCYDSADPSGGLDSPEWVRWRQRRRDADLWVPKETVAEQVAWRQKNFALSEAVEPGSVFKCISVAMALNVDREVSPDRKFPLFRGAKHTVPYARSRNGKISLPGGDSHHFDESSVRDILKYSSNNGAAQVVLSVVNRYGDIIFRDYAARFGFGKPTGLGAIMGVPEAQGTLHWPNSRDKDGRPLWLVTSMAMGHGVGVTPLQLHCAIGALANNGELMAPQIIRSIRFPDAKERVVEPLPAGPPAVTAQTASVMRNMLRGVVLNDKTVQPFWRGTGWRADITEADLPADYRAATGGAGVAGASAAAPRSYEAAGKTGTSQKHRGGTYSSKIHTASFSGFFPAEKPDYVITVVVDEPICLKETTSRTGEKTVVRVNASGGEVAAPIFKQVAASVIMAERVKPPAGR
ncbi:MAG: hypothetical protein LBR07_05290 [Puniceicoccales bacterium]|jgi:cell division protein FtsI/penicillin-binding protein 2|nr:hypothetical protein [Puniceicoccales bacterium]